MAVLDGRQPSWQGRGIRFSYRLDGMTIDTRAAAGHIRKRMNRKAFASRNANKTDISRSIHTSLDAFRYPAPCVDLRSGMLAIMAWSISLGWPVCAGEVAWYTCFRDKVSLERVLPDGVMVWSLGKGAFRPADKLPNPKLRIGSEWETGECPVTNYWNLKQWDGLKSLTKEVRAEPSDLTYLPKGDPNTAVRRAVVRIWPRFTDKSSDSGSVVGQAGTGFVVKRTGDRAWIATARHVLLSSDGSNVASQLGLELYLGSLPTGLRPAIISVDVHTETLARAGLLTEAEINVLSQLLDTLRRNSKDPRVIKNRVCQAEKLGICRVDPDSPKIQQAKAFLDLRVQEEEAELKRVKHLNQMAQSNREEIEDLIVLEVQGLPRDIQPLPLTMGSPQGPLMVVGHPSNKPPWTVASFPLLKTTDKFLVLDGQLEPGASGSPVLNATGEVVGLVYETTSYSGGTLSLISAYRSRLLKRMIP